MALLSLDKIITMEEELYTKYYDFSEVRYNEMTKTLHIKFGVLNSNEMYDFMSKDENTLEKEWVDDLRLEYIKTAKMLLDLLKKNGHEVNVMHKLYNRTDKDELILTIYNGEVIYDKLVGINNTLSVSYSFLANIICLL